MLSHFQPQTQPKMEDHLHHHHEEETSLGSMIVLTNWFPKLVETQVDLITTTLTSIITPSKHPHHRAAFDDTLLSSQTQTQSQTTPAQQLARKVGYGIMGAVYAGVVLTMVMVLAAVVGVVLVNYWVEQPVFVREKLYFDYTDANPQAMFVFGGERKCAGKHDAVGCGVPVGHTFHVSVALLVPDSDYNRDIGVFQLMAEVVSTNGRLIARSSQPSMLQYHSYPIRLMHTFMMGVPILLGITRETQSINVQMIRYKEDAVVRTDAVKITLMPRAGTPYLPQIYEAEIILRSKLPRVKELIHNWKWTFYVWTSLYVYAVLLILLLCFCRTLLVFPMILGLGTTESPERIAAETLDQREGKPDGRAREGREMSETLRKWQQYRRKRKAALLSRSTFTEDVGSTSAASSYTMTKDHDFDDSAMEEEIGDSESICKN